MINLIIINSNSNSSYFEEFNSVFPLYGITYRVMSGKDALHYIPEPSDIFFVRKSELNDHDRIKLFHKLKNHRVINNNTLADPDIKRKSYQQRVLAKDLKKYGIDTYSFNNKKDLQQSIYDGTLSFPFIMKPNIGKQGNGVKLINKLEDITLQYKDIKQQIFQPFIENTGDYRIWVVGGYVAGMVKRIANESDFRNNISQGGSANQVESEYRKILSKIATRVTCYLKLDFAGIDIIKDEKTGKFLIMEINSVPAWTSLQQIQGDEYYPLSHHLAKLIVEKNKKYPSTYKQVSNYYINNFQSLEEYKFHFASRLFLWENNRENKNLCESSAKEYMGGIDTESITNKLIAMSKRIGTGRIKNSNNKERNLYFKKYPDINHYNALFFRLLFAKTIFGIDLSDTIDTIISKEQVIDIAQILSKDKNAISYLSTHAINFFYHIQNIYGLEILSPHEFLSMMKAFDISDSKEKTLCIYLGTHCIIGASGFYSKNIDQNKELYQQMIITIEEIIAHNYFEINLDAKCEFLVCCKILHYTSPLESIIHQECNCSVSESGNFIVDTHNIRSQKNHNIDLIRAEHRNVLYILSNKEYNK